MSRLWPDWRGALVIVRPETVIGWHRKGFRLYWKSKSRRGVGRPGVDREVRRLICQMANENVGWGAPRILGDESRTHLSLGKDAPEPREPSGVENGKVVALPKVGGLHHHYTRHAA